MSKYFKIHAYILIFYAVFSIYTTFSLFAIETADTDGVSYEDESGESSFDEGSFVNLGVDDDGVSIIGTPETTQQIKTIDADEIKRRQPPDLATLLEESLDMGITRYGAYGNQTEINMRGFDTERIAVLIDGVPANSPRSGEFDVNQIDISNVERVEVIYGGSDSKYNVTGAMGGVINIITIKKQKTGVHFGG
ncbi:MAG: TonB-dependent receptor plug domain-containing protein, partial [Treponema sp.]|nr:TonB-dependent receptor plug domain-containing protein [Treponema sp.]